VLHVVAAVAVPRVVLVADAQRAGVRVVGIAVSAAAVPAGTASSVAEISSASTRTSGLVRIVASF
jgi:hypothetical protein